MRIYKQYEVRIPEYAICYIEYNDDSSLSDEDRDNIDNWLKPYHNDAASVNGSIIFDYGDLGSYFTWKPCFGLPCEVIDCVITILVN